MSTQSISPNTTPTHRHRKEKAKFFAFSLREIIWVLMVIATAVIGWNQFQALMGPYEIGILAGVSVSLMALGRIWPSIQFAAYWIAALSLLALWSYHIHNDQYAVHDTAFFLRFLVSSQAAIMWMSVLFLLSMVTYFYALFSQSKFSGKVASTLAWSAVVFGITGMMVRWRESYLINTAYGHIPISSLYEVFILFAVVTALIYLYYEQKMSTRSLGGLVMLVITAAVSFDLWYAVTRDADKILPLVPALKSYWMKIHVPANVVGYGSFTLAAMVGVGYLITEKVSRVSPNNSFIQKMPSLSLMDDLMYKAISLGFAFFTLATILGAVWASEAWGGYWSWDPKETWALIVWLNYAAWLHFRMSKGWRGTAMAWWAVTGLVVTTFAFLGVNMFLKGLHSYGAL
jgi:cytochrome c-type biogenesis protein CcsB